MDIHRVHKNDDISMMLQKTAIKDMIESCEECLVVALSPENGSTKVQGVAITGNPKKTAELLEYLDNMKEELMVGLTSTVLADMFVHKDNDETMEEIAKMLYKGFPYPKRFAEVYKRASDLVEQYSKEEGK